MKAESLLRKWRISIIIISGVLVLLLLSLLFINSYLTPKLSSQLKSAVLKGSDSLYQVDFSHADLHLLRGKAVLYDVTLKPDTAVYHRMQREGRAPAELYELRVREIMINGAHPFKLYFHKQLDIGQITLANPEVQISKYIKVPADTLNKVSPTLYQKLSKTLKYIHVGGISLKGIHCVYQDCTGPKPQVFVLKEMNLEATDLLIDSVTQTDKTRSLFCRDIVTDLHHFKWATADGLYQFKVNSIRLSTRAARLTITGGEMQPIAAQSFFANNKKKWDRYTLYLDKVTLNNFDYQNFRKRQDLNVAHMIVTKGFFEIYTNPNGPPKKTDRIVTYPNYVIRHLQTSLNIDTLDVKHMDVVLSMFNKKSMEAGSIKFSNTTGRLLNITNKKAIITQHPNSTADLTTYLIGKGKLDLFFTFSLIDPAYNYSYNGHLGPLDLQDGNSALMPLGLIKVQSGTERSLDFRMHSTNKLSTGKVTFLYNDLKIALLRHDQQQGYTKKSLISLFANLIVLKNNNPDNDRTSPRSANVVYVRPANIPFFGSIWQAILSGIKPCAGLGKAQEKTATAPMTKKEQKAQDKTLKKAKKNAAKEEQKFKKQQKKVAKEQTN